MKEKHIMIIKLFGQEFYVYQNQLNELGKQLNKILNTKYINDNWNTKFIRKIIRKEFKLGPSIILSQLKSKELNNLWLKYESQ